MRLSGHGAQATDLPKRPFLDLDACALVRRIELPELATEILEDGAGIKHRDRFAAGASGSTIAGIRLFGAIFRNSDVNCSPLPMLMYLTLWGTPSSSSMMLIFQPLGGGPVIKLNRVPS
jgi:hypothetical protein